MNADPVTKEPPKPVSLATRQVLTVPEAAQVLGVSRSFAYTLVNHGEIKAVRLGRRIVVPHHVIDELLGRNTGEEPMPETTLF